MFPNVPRSAVAKAYDPDPPKEAEHCSGGHEREPEPEENEDLLVEEVYRKDALDGVSVHVAHLADLEVAERNARKPHRADVPRLAGDEVSYHLDAVDIVIRAEEEVQHEELEDKVGEVEDLGGHVEGEEIVAVPVATDQAAVFREEVFEGEAAAAPVLSLVV